MKKPMPKAKAGKTTVTYNPATGEKVAEFANTDLKKLPAIIAKARKAQAEWAKLSFRQRAKHVLRMRAYITEHADELARIVSFENGITKLTVDELIEISEILNINLSELFSQKAASSQNSSN